MIKIILYYNWLVVSIICPLALFLLYLENRGFDWIFVLLMISLSLYYVMEIGILNQGVRIK